MPAYSLPRYTLSASETDPYFQETLARIRGSYSEINELYNALTNAGRQRDAAVLRENMARLTRTGGQLGVNAWGRQQAIQDIQNVAQVNADLREASALRDRLAATTATTGQLGNVNLQRFQSAQQQSMARYSTEFQNQQARYQAALEQWRATHPQLTAGNVPARPTSFTYSGPSNQGSEARRRFEESQRNWDAAYGQQNYRDFPSYGGAGGSSVSVTGAGTTTPPTATPQPKTFNWYQEKRKPAAPAAVAWAA